MDQQHRVIKTVILGGERTGKTALVKKYIDAVFTHDYEPLYLGGDQKQLSVDGRTYTLDLNPAEPAGEQILCQTGEAFILLYAINNRRSFQHINQVHQQLRSARGTALSRIPVFLVGSKTDLESERQVSLEEARDLAIELRCQKLFEISAKTHEGEISDLFDKLVQQLIVMESGPDTPARPNPASVNNTPTRPPLAVTPQSPSSPSFRQSQEKTSTTNDSPRRTSSVFDRLKFGSMKRKPSMQSITRKKSGSFTNMMGRNQSRDELQSGENVPTRSSNNVRSVSAGNILNGSQSITPRPAAPPSRQSNTLYPTPFVPMVPLPYKLDVDTSAWRDSIKWPTEIIPEEDMMAPRR